jgi:hypothetical protein
MRNAKGGPPLFVVVAAVGITMAGACAAEETAAETFVRTVTDKVCDQFNRSWAVTNEHTYLSIKVTVWWSAVGAKEMQEEFVLPPSGGRTIGCAAELKIVTAQIMHF